MARPLEFQYQVDGTYKANCFPYEDRLIELGTYKANCLPCEEFHYVDGFYKANRFPYEDRLIEEFD